MPLRTPTARQLAGLGVTLAVVALFSFFMQAQIAMLRRLQTDTVDRNRRDSLQLVRIQNDLNQLGLTMRDLESGDEPYPLIGYRPQFERLRTDLDDAIAVEARLAPPNRNPGQQALLRTAFERFWSEMDRVWQSAAAGRDNDARALIRTRLDAERATITTLVARLLVQNTEADAAAQSEIQGIYARVERTLWMLLAAVLFAIAATSLYVLRVNRRVFQQLEDLSAQRQLLASKMISVQEDVFRTLARELHDEFGQVLTAIGVMLQRAARHVPEGSPALDDLREVREIANQSLDKARSLSQMLHPPILDDYGLDKSIEWYTGKFATQTGLEIHYERSGVAPWIGDQVAIHVYRILQEALNNVVRHSGASEAWVRAGYGPHTLELQIEDHGNGLSLHPQQRGIGIIAMRERAALIHGTLSFSAPEAGGTRVTLHVPLTMEEAPR